MQVTKGHKILVRGLTKSEKNKLKVIARKRTGGSVNKLMLSIIGIIIQYHDAPPQSVNKEKETA